VSRKLIGLAVYTVRPRITLERPANIEQLRSILSSLLISISDVTISLLID